MRDWNRSYGEVVGFEELTRRQVHKLDLDRQSLIVEDDAKQQRLHTVQGRFPAEDLDVVDVLPTRERRHKPA